MLLICELLIFFIFLFQKETSGQYNDLRCEFSDGVWRKASLCKWTPDNEISYVFIKGKARDMTPISDGPLGSSDFKGSYIELIERQASLVSRQITTPDFCLSFYYYLFGPTKGEISISRTNGQSRQSEIIYYRNQDHENIDKWHHFQATIPGHKERYFYTITTKREDWTQISIDKIVPRSSACASTRYYCDFDLSRDDNLNCQWLGFTSSNESYTFKVTAPYEKEYDIVQDHSSRSQYGNYLTAKDFETAPIGTIWSVMFPVTQMSSPKHCLSFWIYQNSFVDVTLFYQEEGSDADPVDFPIWHSKESNKPFWAKKMFTITKVDNSPYLGIKLDMKKLEGSDKPIGIDSILYVEGECPKPATCDFNENFCAFESVGSKWLVGSGRLANPSNMGLGFVLPSSISKFAYTDFSLTSKKETAYLRSDEVPPGDYCLKWNEYHSKFADHSFEIHLSDSHDTRLFQIYKFSDASDQRTWQSRSESVLATELEHDFRFLFVVESIQGFTALDDIDLNIGKCEKNDKEEPVTKPTTDIDVSLEQLSCDFERVNTCAWYSKTDGGNRAVWKLSDKDDYKTHPNMPRADKTLESYKGHFIYVDQHEMETSAILAMKVTNSSVILNGPYCLEFHSVIKGEGTKELKVNFITAKNLQSVDVWPSNKWQLTQVDFELSESVEVNLVGQRSGDAVVAVDDIVFKQGLCQKPHLQGEKLVYSCDFKDYAKCEINVDTINQDEVSPWARDQRETYQLTRDPVISVEISEPTEQGRTRFYLPRLKPRVKTCLTFWYLMEAAENVTFRVLLEDGLELEDDDQQSEVVVELSENNKGNWNPVQVEIADESEWRLVFEVEVIEGNDFKNIIAVTDISVKRGACPSYYSCNFDDESCLWHNIREMSADYNIRAFNRWNRQHTQSVTRGSEFPKSTAEGNQGSYFITGGQTSDALLLSPRFDWPDSDEVKSACFTFWDYFVNGEGGGTVFYMAKLTDTADAILNMNLDGSSSHQWVRKKVQIERSSDKSFWLVFYAHKKYYSSFNALDDIRVQFKPCSANHNSLTCDKGTKTLSEDQICNFIYDCDDKSDEMDCGYSCDYSKDKNYCGWTATPSTSWIIKNWGNLPSSLNLPALSPGSKAVFDSPTFKKSMAQCQIQFDADYDPKHVKVVAEISVEGQNNIEVWSSNYLQSTDKAGAKFATGKINADFKVTLSVVASSRLSQADRETSLSGIKFNDNCFHERYSDDRCLADFFKCDNGRCIPEHEICNVRDDCGDNSDEADKTCPNMDMNHCDFSSFCFFRDEPKMKYFPSSNERMTGFELRQGFDEISQGPTRDNTDNSKKGWFAYLPVSRKFNTRESSLITEHTLSECASFYVYSRGQVTLTVNNFAIPISQEPIWQLHYVEGLSYHDPLTIKATTSDSGSYLAIDDFSWGTKCSGKSAEPTTQKPTRPPNPQDDQIYKELTCDFHDQNKLCDWSLTYDEDYRRRRRSDFSANRDGPLEVSTLSGHQSADSSFLVLLATNRLMTRPFLKTVEDQEICFSFEYYMFGNLGSLEVNIFSKELQTTTTLFHRNQEYGNIDEWKKYSLNLPYTKGEFRPVVSADIKSKDTVIALDNFIATPGKCQQNNNYCDFDRSRGEKLDCDWLTYVDSDEVKWSAKFPGTLPDGPAVDHSSKSIYGRYLTSMAVKSLTSVSRNLLFLTPADPSWEHCLTFWYYRPEPDDDEISVVYIRTESGKDVETNLLALRHKGAKWAKVTVTLPYHPHEHYRYAIVIAKSPKKPKSVIGLDSIFLLPGACSEPLSCDFNLNFCGYTTASDSDDKAETRWLIGQGRLYDPYQVKGENGINYNAFGAPGGAGRFAYVDLTAPNLDKATKYNLRLESDPWRVETYFESTCLRFKYYLNGEFPTDSSFLVKLWGVDAAFRRDIWTLDKPESFQWILQEVDISGVQSYIDVELRFELNSKPSPFVLALADVEVTPGVACDGSSYGKTAVLGAQSISCNFDDGSFCSWKLDNNQLFPWKISDKDAITKNMYLPKFDHTTMGQNGSYAYMATTRDEKQFSKLQLLLTEELMKPDTYCFSLWSLMNVKFHHSTLVVKIRDVTSGEESVSKVHKSSSWTFFEIEFIKEVNKDLQVSIIAESKYDGQVTSIDDIEFHQGKCDASTSDRDTLFYCTFEGTNDCGIAASETVTNGLSWTKTSDVFDHTNYPINSGYSMMVKMKSNEEGSKIFYTRYVHPRENACAMLWYKMETKNDPSVTLKIKLVRTLPSDDYVENEDLIYEDSGYRGLRQWHPFIYQVEYKGQWRLAVELSYNAVGNRGQDLIAIDDIVITRGECPSQLSCDFNDDKCPWLSLTRFLGSADNLHEEHRLDLQWERTASTLADQPLPQLDSQGKAGNYLVLSGKSGEGVFRSPRLEWPTTEQTITSQGCLTFFAYKSGDAQIDTYLGTSFDGWIPKVKGSKLTDSAKWQKLQFSIEQMGQNKYFWLYILGYIGQNSLLAIDDISVTFGQQCLVSMELFKCANGALIDHDKRCDFKEDCLDKSDEIGCSYGCDFSDKTLCGYRPKGNTFLDKWALASETVLVKLEQHKLPCAAVEIGREERAELHSVTYRNAGPRCQFKMHNWLYIIRSPDNVDFTVDISIDGQRRIEVYDSSVRTVMGHKVKKEWRNGNAYIGEIKSEFELIISLNVKGNSYALAAIDEFRFVDCFRNDFPKVDCQSRFQCGNHKCIPWYQLCDGQNDCEDNSDETEILCYASMRCNFDDNGYCGGVAEGFALISGRAKLLDGPTRDHTTNSHQGSYVITKSLNASIVVPNRTTFIARCITFYIQVWAKRATLTVDNQPVKIVVDQPGLWQQINVETDGSAHIKISQDGAGWVAVDDIVYNTRCYGDREETVPTAPPVLISTPPSEPKFPEVNFFCHESAGKVPKYTICDDVLDCPSGEDETRKLCGEIKCADSGIFCQLVSNNETECLKDTRLFCDGKKDCTDGMDEDSRLCNTRISCNGWCQRQGVCKPKNGRLDSCSCPAPFYGKRCQYPDVVPLTTTPETEKQTTRPVVTLPTKVPTKPTPVKPNPTKPTVTTAKSTENVELNKNDEASKKSFGLGAIMGFTIIVIILSSAAAYFVYRKRFWNREDDDTQPINALNNVPMEEVRLPRESESGQNDDE